MATAQFRNWHSLSRLNKKIMAKANSKIIEEVKDLENQTVDSNEVKKGYNEKNEVQPEGSFTPDSKDSEEVAPKKPKK